MAADTLPWSAEAEQGVLGAILLDSDAMGRISDRRLEAAHFFDHRHRAIWSAVVAMTARHLPIDVVTVFEALRDAGDDERAGGLLYLNALTQSVPSAANVARYADIVLEKALRRAVIAAADEVQTLAREPGDADELLDRAASIFGAIQRTKGADGPRSLRELFALRMAEWEATAAGTAAPGIATGISTLDEALGGGMKPGKVIVLAARPSVGKSSLALQIGLNVAEQGHRVLIISQEMEWRDIVDRAAANLGDLALDKITGNKLRGDDWHAVADAAEAVLRRNIDIDDRPGATLLDVRAKARRTQHGGGLSLLIVDYLQLCRNVGKSDRRHHQIEEISRGMKVLAKELGVCVLLLSQLNRDAANSEPELDQLKESGAIEEDADTVILLHPMGHESDGALLVLAKIAKNRQGRRGRLALSLYGKTQQWATSSGNVSRRAAE